MDFIEEFIDFLIGASEQTRQHVDAVIKEAIACSVKVVLALPKIKITISQKWQILYLNLI